MQINKRVTEQIYQHALKEYPYECCGIVTMEGNNQTVHICRNIQNSLHREDPERNPRDARTAYTIDRDEVDRIYSEAKKKGEEIIAFYHSHIDCEAYFSETDKDAQTVFGEPEFPDAVHLIVAVIGGDIQGMKCYKWDKEKEVFVLLQLS
jgi:proteasome lid subunit RPN8/RPN11